MESSCVGTHRALPIIRPLRVRLVVRGGAAEHHATVVAPVLHELLMAALLQDATVAEHDDGVGMAVISVVVSFDTFSTARCSSASVCESMLAVASSRISTAGWWAMARAKDSS